MVCIYLQFPESRVCIHRIGDVYKPHCYDKCNYHSKALASWLCWPSQPDGCHQTESGICHRASPGKVHEEELKCSEVETSCFCWRWSPSSEKAPIKDLPVSLSVQHSRVLIKSKEVSTWKLTTVLWLLVETGHNKEKSCDILRKFCYF